MNVFRTEVRFFTSFVGLTESVAEVWRKMSGVVNLWTSSFVLQRKL